MTASEFFNVFFANLEVFLLFMCLFSGLLYLTVRKIALAGYLDPIHFYWTFTFGSAYGVVAGLYWCDQISMLLCSYVFGCGLLFILCFGLFSHYRWCAFQRVFHVLTVPRGEGRFEFYLVLFFYLSLLLVILSFVGAGLFAETNRFEQNRGFGVFVRISDAFRLFVVAYLAISVVRSVKTRGLTWSALFQFGVLMLLIVLGSAMNGAKFALLEALYACFVALSIYFGKPRFQMTHLVVVFVVALSFALLGLTLNLRNNNVDTEAEATYIQSAPVVVERLAFRILANADKYFMGLPNDVIDKIEVDNLLVRFLSPIVGVTRLSGVMGYDVSRYNVGRQLLLYFDPDYKVAGGPTSHFDLFAYKYFGLGFAAIWVVITAFLLASVNALGRSAPQNIFYCALVSALWLRSLPILLEPPVGLAYMLDIIFLFALIKLIGWLVPRKG